MSKAAIALGIWSACLTPITTFSLSQLGLLPLQESNGSIWLSIACSFFYYYLGFVLHRRGCCQYCVAQCRAGLEFNLQSWFVVSIQAKCTRELNELPHYVYLMQTTWFCYINFKSLLVGVKYEKPMIARNPASLQSLWAQFIRKAIPDLECSQHFSETPGEIPCPPDWLESIGVECR